MKKIYLRIADCRLQIADWQRKTAAASFCLLLLLSICNLQSAICNPPDDADDTQDLLYLGDGRPAVLRLHLQIDGKPVFARWDEWMGRLFRFLDRNGSGTLDRVEGGKSPAVQDLLMFFQGNVTVFRGRAAQPSVPFDTLDADRDGRVTLEEFRDYYRKNGAGPVLVASASAAGGRQDSLTDILFTALDTSKDGKLSQEELLAAEKVLARYDTSDDELVSMGELGFNPNPAQVRQAVLLGGQPAPEPPKALMLVPREGGRRMSARLELAREVVARLDKDKSSKLSREESGFTAGMFEKLDRNRDGQLDVLELGRWLSSKPDGEFTVQVGQGRGQLPPAARSRAFPLTPVKAAESMSLHLENVRLTVQPLPLQMAPTANLTRFLLNQYRQLDADKKGFVSKRQIDPNQHFLATIFDMADRNNDGRLTEEEMKAYTDLFTGAYGTQLSLTLISSGLGMFQTLDTNNDGQLSIREMRNAWSRLAVFDRDSDGCISKSEFPQQFNLTVSTGVNLANFPAVAFLGNRRGPGPRASSGPGPLWFRKMDRNGDGDVSRLEWLGTKEEFDRIDTDKDGLIGLAEAEASDARVRAKAD